MASILSIIDSDKYRDQTTFNFTLLAAFLADNGENTAEIVVMNQSAEGFIGKFTDAGITKRTSATSYDTVVLNHSGGVQFCVDNGITATRYLFICHFDHHEDPTEQLGLLPPSPGIISALLEGNIEVFALSEQMETYLEGLGHTVTLIRSAVDTARFTAQTAPTAIKKVLITGNSEIVDKLTELAQELPELFVRSLNPPVWSTEDEIDNADMVIGTGRLIIEAMAMGIPAVIIDEHGGDGMVLDANKADLAKSNFQGYSYRNLPVIDHLEASHLLGEIQRFTPADLPDLRTYIENNFATSQLLTAMGLTTP